MVSQQLRGSGPRRPSGSGGGSRRSRFSVRGVPFRRRRRRDLKPRGSPLAAPPRGWKQDACRGGRRSQGQPCGANVSGSARIKSRGDCVLWKARVCKIGTACYVLSKPYRECRSHGEKTHRLELKFQWLPLDVDRQSAIFRSCSVHQNPERSIEEDAWQVQRVALGTY